MKVGIAGVGFMGTTHAHGWAQTDAQIAGLAAETPAEAKDLAKKYGATVYSDFESMLKDVDIVDICTPTHLHYKMVMKAAAQGKHIVCEKPLSRTIEQAQQMVSACREAGVQLLVAHVVRFFPEYALAKAAVSAWVIATRRRMRACWFSRSSTASSAILNMLLPNRLPAARLGACSLNELIMVSSSGREVAAANKRTPMNIPPRRVRTATTSPYWASLTAAITRTALLAMKVSQTIGIYPDSIESS